MTAENERNEINTISTNNTQQINTNIENKSEVLNSHGIKEKIPFEDALELTGVGKYNYCLLAISVYTLLAACAEIFSIGLVVTSSQCDLELDIFKKGLINSIPMLGVAAGSHFWGYLADTKGRRLTLTICTFGTMVFAVMSSFSNHWIFMMITKFGSALCAFGSNAIIFALLGETTPVSIRSPFLLYASMGLMCTQAMIICLTYPTLHLDFSYYFPLINFKYRPWRLATLLIGLISGLNFILLWLFTFESPKFYFGRGDHDRGLEILKKIYAHNSGNDVKTYKVKRVFLEEDINQIKKGNILKSMWDQTIPLFTKNYIKNTLLVCYICITAYCITPPFIIWLPEIFNIFSRVQDPNMSFCQMFQMEMIPASNNQNTTMETVCDDSIAEVTYVALGSVAIYLLVMSSIVMLVGKRLSKKWIYIGIHFITTAAALTVNHVNSLWGVVCLVAMMINIVCAGITTAFAVELFPTYMRAMAVCLTIMVGRGVSFIFINIIGTQLLRNCDNFLYFTAAFALFLIYICVGFWPELSSLFKSDIASIEINARLYEAGTVVGIFLPSDKKTHRSDSKQNDVEKK